ncbi:MAG: GMC family oxidoreductase [Alphaproteobacteria bacterium]|nr:GMC family oxidoreductase [Alphaproteobacteria bacterium]
MSHTAFLERGDDRSFVCDWVVVGSGAGGATAAEYLSRHGEKVVLVEAGAWRDPEHYPTTAYGAMRDLLEDWGAQITRGRAFWPIVQARTVGGTTVVNSAIAVRTPDDIYALWRAEHGIGGELFEAAMKRFQDQLDDELKVEVGPPESRGRNNELAYAAGEATGIEHHYMRRYVKDCEGSGQCMQGCKSGHKQSLNTNFVPAVLERGGEVLSNAPVKRVFFKGNHAIGVTGRFRHPGLGTKGGRFTVRARRGVIVAASATHSPALLQRSRVRLPALGHYFRSHPGTGVFGLFDEPVDMNRGNTQGWASIQHRTAKHAYKLETLAIPPEMVITRIKGGGTKFMERVADYRHLTMWVLGLRAQATTGTVRNGLFDKPVVSYTLCREDLAAFRSGLAEIARLQFAAGAKAVMPGVHGLPYMIGPDEIHRIEEAPLDPRYYIAILSHLFGGCVMGADPRTSVCDLRGRVHGHEGLYIADASMIPTVLGVNPQHTVMSLSRWVAANLVEG